MTTASTAKPAFLLVQVQAKNLEALVQRYAGGAIQSLAQFGGEMIAGTPAPKVFEGKWEGNWAAVLRFPSLEMAEAWYNSPEYQPWRELRIQELTDGGQVLLIEGM